MSDAITLVDIHEQLSRLGGWGNLYIPEFTWDRLRIDGITIDVRTRWIRGFEIKMSRADFLADEKWMNYVEFCSSVSIVCPEGLIEKHEVKKPFGLIYAKKDSGLKYIKKAKRFQNREGYAWHYTYMRVLEKEIPRIHWELYKTKERFNNLIREKERKN